MLLPTIVKQPVNFLVTINLQKISLTKHELVQLANLRPRSAVDIQLLIENSEERLNDQQVEEVLRVVSEPLPGPPEGEEEEEEGADESEGEGAVDTEDVNAEGNDKVEGGAGEG